MRYQVLKVISVFLACVYVFVCKCECVFSLPFCLFVFSFLIEKCWLRLSPSVKWGAAWPQIIMTFAVCLLPECRSVMESTACKERERKKKVLLHFLYEYKYITWGYLLLCNHLENWLWMCKDSFLFLPLPYYHMFVCNSYLLPSFTLFSHFQPQGSKITHSVDVSQQ